MDKKNIQQRNVSGNNIVVSGNGNIVSGGNLRVQRVQITESDEDTNIIQENVTGNNIVSSGDNLIVGDDTPKPESEA